MDGMNPSLAIATLADVEAIERVPLERRRVADNVYDALRLTAERNADRPAIHFIPTGAADDPVTTYSYAAFMRRVTQSANLFQSLGVGPDDVVSLLMPVLPETFFCLWGAETAAVANPINWLLEPSQLAGILNEAKAKIVVACAPEIVPDIWPKLAAIAGQIPTLKAIVCVGGRPAVPVPGVEIVDYAAVIDGFRGDGLDRPRRIGPDDVAALFHTGGTTGVPKLAQHTHGGLTTQALTNGLMLRPGPGEIYFNGLPPFHVGGATCAGLMPLVNGATIVMLTAAGMRNPRVVNNFWKLVERFRPTVVGNVPTSWGALLNVPIDGADISSIKLINCGGSTMPVEIANALVKLLGVPVVEGYGMTELHGFSTMNPAAGTPRIGSIGLRAPYCELIVAELQGDRIARRCAPGEIGAVLMRGPQVFKGYVVPAHNEGAWVAAEENDPNRGRWLNSGDLGRFDEDGFVWLTGRAKDLIIRGGHNIDPIVIEEVLHQHPAVESAAAVGRPDRHAGELPVAFVQLRPGHGVTGEELQAFAKERIPERAAAPVEVIVLELMPVTGVGKIFKPQLRHEAAQRTFERVLAPLAADGIVTEVAVGPHRDFGTLATIRIAKAPDRAAAEARIAALLTGFPQRWQIA